MDRISKQATITEIQIEGRSMGIDLTGVEAVKVVEIGTRVLIATGGKLGIPELLAFLGRCQKPISEAMGRALLERFERGQHGPDI